MKSNYKGFSLVEVMVALAIVGIVSSIAYPAYVQHVLGTNRTAAGACLTEVSQSMERSYTAAFSYAGIELPALQCIDDLGVRYSFSLSNLAARTYTANASPVGAQTNDDCGALTLNQAGTKSANGSSDIAVVRQCW